MLRLRGHQNGEHSGPLPQKREHSSKERRGIRSVAQLRSRLTSSLESFWFEDLPPLHGPVRIVFYLSLLLVLLTEFDGSGHSALRARSCKSFVERFAHYENLGFPVKVEAGFFRLLVQYLGIDPAKAFNCDSLTRTVRWSLFLSGIGLGWRVPRVTAAVSWWIMFGIKMITFGKAIGHEQYLPGVAMIVLCFSESNLIDRWSVDSQLVKIWTTKKTGVPPAAPPGWDGGPSPGRGARKFVVFQASCVMFFAGVHKFASYGFRWLDGATIYRSIKGQEGRSPAMQEVFLHYAWFFAPIMATVSVVGELSAFAAVFSPRWRPYVIASWCGFHLGIFLLMHPNFAMNMCTYMLCIDWRPLLRGTISYWNSSPLEKRGASVSPSSPLPKALQETQKRNHFRVGAYIYTMAAVLMFTTALLRIDFFPFSSWALYNTHPSDPGYHEAYTIEEATNAAARCLRQPPLTPACGNLGGSGHHDGWMDWSSRYIDTIVVTGRDDTSGTNKKSKKHCSTDEFRVYKNWEPHSCRRGEDGEDTSALSLRVQELLRDGTKKRKDRRPRDLPDDTWDSKTVDGMEWRVSEAVAASIDEGPKCFAEVENNAFGTAQHKEDLSMEAWKADPSRWSTASVLARRLRANLMDSKDYIPDGEKVLGVAIFFEFMDTQGELRVCKIGESVVGDGDLLQKGIERTHPSRHGYWTEVNRGIVLVLVLGLLVYPSLGLL